MFRLASSGEFRVERTDDHGNLYLTLFGLQFDKDLSRSDGQAHVGVEGSQTQSTISELSLVGRLFALTGITGGAAVQGAQQFVLALWTGGVLEQEGGVVVVLQNGNVERML